MADRYQYRVYEWERPGVEELLVAQGEAPTKIAALRELGHYLTVYGQDGPVRGEYRKNRNKWREIPQL